jgi:valyl-tRNA synthetase
MEKLIEVIRAIRNRRAEMNVPPSKKASLQIVSGRSDVFNEKSTKFFEKLASASNVAYPCEYADETAVQIVTDAATVYIPMGDLVDFEKELARLTKEKEKTEGEILRLEKKLGNEGFVAKAPAAVIEGEKAKLAKYKDTLASLEAAIQKIKR